MDCGFPLQPEKKALYRDLPASSVPLHAVDPLWSALDELSDSPLALSRAMAYLRLVDEPKVDSARLATGAARCPRFFLGEGKELGGFVPPGLLSVEIPELSGVVGYAAVGGTGSASNMTDEKGGYRHSQ